MSNFVYVCPYLSVSVQNCLFMASKLDLGKNENISTGLHLIFSVDAWNFTMAIHNMHFEWHNDNVRNNNVIGSFSALWCRNIYKYCDQWSRLVPSVVLSALVFTWDIVSMHGTSSQCCIMLCHSKIHTKVSILSFFVSVQQREDSACHVCITILHNSLEKVMTLLCL